MSRFRLPQTATYWTPLTNDGFGGKTWGNPVKIKARIANRNEVMFDNEGKQITINKAVYSKANIPIGSYVVEGDSTFNNSPVDNAFMIIKNVSNQSMSDMYMVLAQ